MVLRVKYREEAPARTEGCSRPVFARASLLEGLGAAKAVCCISPRMLVLAPAVGSVALAAETVQTECGRAASRLEVAASMNSELRRRASCDMECLVWALPRRAGTREKRPTALELPRPGTKSELLDCEGLADQFGLVKQSRLSGHE